MDASETKDEIDPLLLEILVCPVTKQPLTYDKEAQELVSKAAGLAYPVYAPPEVLIRSLWALKRTCLGLRSCPVSELPPNLQRDRTAIARHNPH